LGSQDPAQVQIHDFNPGDLNEFGRPNHFAAGGVFWTLPVAEESVRVRSGHGDAHFRLTEVFHSDYFKILNALFRTGPLPLDARASLDIRWAGTRERRQVNNDTAGFRGQYTNATATIEWSAANAAGYVFSTANSSETNITHAFTARVQSGVFHERRQH
jgi:hypothetical protein